MKTFASASFTAAAIFSLLATTALAQDNGHPSYRSIKVGDVHPDFELPNIQDRTPIQLSKYRGKKVLLLHFASW